MANQVLVVVPLRLASERLPKKVLAKIGTQSLGSHTLARTLKAVAQFGTKVRVVAAVDSERVQAALQTEVPKLQVIMTSPDLASGTDRVAAAAAIVQRSDPSFRPIGIVNVQGDTPFVGSDGLRQVVEYFCESSSEQLKSHPICTLAQEWEGELRDPSKVKVLVNQRFEAIYFSRLAIPYSRKKPKGTDRIPMLHIGVYGYTPEALAEFCVHKVSPLEVHEGLEQLRALDLGMKILVFKTEAGRGESFRGIDTAEDLSWARRFVKKRSP